MGGREEGKTVGEEDVRKGQEGEELRCEEGSRVGGKRVGERLGERPTGDAKP